LIATNVRKSERLESEKQIKILRAAAAPSGVHIPPLDWATLLKT
jgi:hypothetical protein